MSLQMQLLMLGNSLRQTLDPHLSLLQLLFSMGNSLSQAAPELRSHVRVWAEVEIHILLSETLEIWISAASGGL